ncbi:GRAS family transcription factor [Striga asiatica]|uniref:GRAS family transcription factor n=1 Tax=Striga asiatica TaxID=4170 RepID=A0A5A7QEA0_STRAF|nr:GRAS family transcription factor [Striga asiatica]
MEKSFKTNRRICHYSHEKMVPEEGSSSSTPFSSEKSPKCPQPTEMKSEERGLCLVHLLIACANHVASNNLENANVSLDYISRLASINGDTMQRISAHFAEALADRMLRIWPGLHRALTSARITSSEEEIQARNLFFDLCPFLKVSQLITNQAILEAMEGEKVVHVIDLDCFEPSQWVGLIRALSNRPEGPPHLKITGLQQNKGVLDRVAFRLNEEAEKLDIPFQFNPIVCEIESLDFDSLHVKSGEAVAVSCVFRLHSLLASDDDVQMPKMTNFLNGLWGLFPKIVMVTEQESNHNKSNLMDRVMEALNFYGALFDCLECTLPVESLERRKIERNLYGKEINNIVACESVDRKTRHEKLEKWVRRLEFVGFGKVSLSYEVMVQARIFLQSFKCNGYNYRVREENGCFFICWQDKPLFSVSGELESLDFDILHVKSGEAVADIRASFVCPLVQWIWAEKGRRRSLKVSTSGFLDDSHKAMSTKLNGKEFAFFDWYHFFKGLDKKLPLSFFCLISYGDKICETFVELFLILCFMAFFWINLIQYQSIGHIILFFLLGLE